jgi:pyridoxal phosphate enzyme (YggS family)
MQTLDAQFKQVCERLHAAERQFQRPAGSVQLLAVSKTQPPQVVEHAYRLGQRAFGENYLQEALAKIAALAHLDLQWHFIGRIQSNKTQIIAEHFDWVHSVDRLKIADLLSKHRPADRSPLNLCLQINLQGETGKGGIAPGEAAELAGAIASLPRIKLRGLMCIPEPSTDFAAQRRVFARLRELSAELNAHGLALDTLSMGMSDDLEAAVAEGATLVRIGTAIFGPRT